MLVVVVLVAERHIFMRTADRDIVCKTFGVDVSAVQTFRCIPCDMDKSLLVEVFHCFKIAHSARFVKTYVYGEGSLKTFLAGSVHSHNRILVVG